VTGTPLPVAAIAAALVVLVLVVLLVVWARSRSAAPRPAQGATGPSSPTAIVCSFCKREYDPAETGGRCPGCGAAAPR
jgi:hypothetical protein